MPQYNLAEAALDNGAIDFYALLDAAPSAEAEALRVKIQALYAESQANRDHRNLNKRREYQTLLELLPTARAVLLDEAKRARYDAYLEAAHHGETEIDFESFINNLLGLEEQMEEKTSLLGVQDKKEEPRARVIKTPVATPKPRERATVGSAPTPSIAPRAGIGAGIGLVLGAIIGYFLGGIVPALLLGLVLAGIGFVALNAPAKRRVTR